MQGPMVSYKILKYLNSNFLILISLQPDGVHFWYFKLYLLFKQTECAHTTLGCKDIRNRKFKLLAKLNSFFLFSLTELSSQSACRCYFRLFQKFSRLNSIFLIPEYQSDVKRKQLSYSQNWILKLFWISESISKI